jgi:hypothetical protein
LPQPTLKGRQVTDGCLPLRKGPSLPVSDIRLGRSRPEMTAVPNGMSIGAKSGCPGSSYLVVSQ